MENLKKWAGAAALTGLALTTHIDRASARTVLALSGTTGDGATNGTFSAGPGLGVVQTVGDTLTWIVPLQFDGTGNKAVTVRGRAHATGGLFCFGAALGTNGNAVSTTGWSTFPTNGTFTALSMTITNVPAGGTGVVICNITGSEAAELLSVEYAP